MCEFDGLLSAHPVSDSLSSLVLPCSVLKCCCACLCRFIYVHVALPLLPKESLQHAYLPIYLQCAYVQFLKEPVSLRCACAHTCVKVHCIYIVCTFVQIALQVFLL